MRFTQARVTHSRVTQAATILYSGGHCATSTSCKLTGKNALRIIKRHDSVAGFHGTMQAALGGEAIFVRTPWLVPTPLAA